MRLSMMLLVALTAFTNLGRAQQPNGVFSALNIDAVPSQAVIAPVIVPTMTDTCFNVNVQALPASPVILVFSTSFAAGGALSIGAAGLFGFQIDIPDQGVAGYDDQILINGWTNPGTATWIPTTTPRLAIPLALPSCRLTAAGPVCITALNWEVAVQGVVVDPSAPFGIRSTGAALGQMLNGHREYSTAHIPNDGFVTFNFLQGLTVPFYGQSHAQVHVSENGYITFGQAPFTGFPVNTVAAIRTGPPRIMAFFNDLEFSQQAFNPRISVDQFRGKDGVRRVRVTHQRVAEFFNQTGPHGGEAVITAQGDIAVFVHSYNSQPSIPTAVGITGGSLLSQNVTGNGRNLDQDLASALGPTPIGPGAHGFEMFPTSGGTAAMDIIGANFFGPTPVGPGITFLLDPTTPNASPNTTGYIIQ